jgi:hypothetical protein
VGAETVEPEREPAALKARVSRKQDPFPRPKLKPGSWLLRRI